MFTSALYAGSFDPITNGHLWVIKTASNLFDRLVVAVGDNKSKKYMFSKQERVDLVIKAIQPNIDGKIEVESLDNQYLVDFAAKLNVKYLIRGVRNIQDFEFEKTLQNVNSEINPELTTIWLCPPKNLSEVSSSVVKSLIGPVGWRNVVGKMVPTHVLTELQNKLFLNGEMDTK